MKQNYRGDVEAKDPSYSPFKEFPPAVITTGTRDIMLRNCVRLLWKIMGFGKEG
jgi:hypothetical protein